MKLIDEKLGGTTPLNIVLKFDKQEIELAKKKKINLKIGMKKAMKKIRVNIGSQKIKLIE